MTWAKTAMAAMVTLATIGGARASEPAAVQKPRVVFRPAADEQTLEKQIAAFLRGNNGLYVYEGVIPGTKDLVLRVPFADPATRRPSFVITIDTLVSARRMSQVTERVIILTLMPATQPSRADRAHSVEAARAMQLKIWGPQFVVDDEGAVALQWALNVLPQGLPAEYLLDAMDRLVAAWHKLEEALNGRLSAPTRRRAPRPRYEGQREESARAILVPETLAVCAVAPTRP